MRLPPPLGRNLALPPERELSQLAAGARGVCAADWDNPRSAVGWVVGGSAEHLRRFGAWKEAVTGGEFLLRKA